MEAWGWGGGDMPRMGVRPVGLGSGQDLVLCDVASRLPSLNGVFSPGGPSQLCCAGGKPPESECHMAFITQSGHSTCWPSLGEGEAGFHLRDEDFLLKPEKVCSASGTFKATTVAGADG